MIYADSHTHTHISPDSTATLAEMAQAAVDAGLEVLTVTDHYDLIDFSGKVCLHSPREQAWAEYRSVRDAFQGRLDLRYGMELGEALTDFAAAEDALLEPLDFVIASVHNLDLSAGGTDFYDFRYTDDPQLCHQHLLNYFDQLQKIAEWGQFDVIGHIPYLLRYMRDRDGVPITLARYEEPIRQLLKTVVEQGKGIEVNTTRGQTVEDNRQILLWFRELGGEYVTLGSDAHQPADVAKGIREGLSLMAQTGFSYQTVYHQRTPELYLL